MYTSHPIVSDWILEEVRREQEEAIARHHQNYILRQAAGRRPLFQILPRWLARRTDKAPRAAALCCNDVASA